MKAVALVLLAYFSAASGWLRKTVDRPKVTGIAFVRVKVSSLRNDSLYRSLFERPLGIGSCISFEGQCYFVNLFQRIELVKLENAENGNLLEAVGFYTSDVRAMHGFLAGHGFKPGEIISDRHGTTYFEVRDPERHGLFFVSQPEGIGASTSGGPRIAGDILHAGWVVRDREAMDRFYRDVLGFRVYWHGGMKDGETNWVDMQVPEGTDWIEYMLNVPAKADARERGVQNHFALGVDKIQSAASQLHQNGLEKLDGPEIGRDGKWSLDVSDPDGTRVEVMEFTPAKDPCCHPYTADHPKP